MKKIILITTLIISGFANKIMAQNSSVHPLENVIYAYLELKNELTKDNSSAIQKSANTFYDALNQVPMDKLSPAEQKVWIDYLARFNKDADRLRMTDDLEYKRELFSNVSNNLYTMLLVLNINSIDLYYQYCPMANNGKGAYWISEQEGILNPYFGKRMLRCGSTKETLAAKE